jgi:hypothetical protein
MTKILLVLLPLSAIYSMSAHAEGIPESGKADYVKEFRASCLIKQRTEPLSKWLSEEQRGEYCDCAASRSVDTITLEEIGTMLKTQSQDAIKPHLTAVANYCGEKLMSKWLPK